MGQNHLVTPNGFSFGIVCFFRQGVETACLFIPSPRVTMARKVRVGLSGGHSYKISVDFQFPTKLSRGFHRLNGRDIQYYIVSP